MRRPLRSFLLLLTAMSALAAGALNGRVLCIGDEGHVAVEDPHKSPAQAGCCRGHGHAGRAGEARGDEDQPQLSADESHGGCVDIHSDATLARQTASPGYDHRHLPVADVVVSAAAATAPVALPAGLGPTCLLRFDDDPSPGAGDLAALRTIVLTV